MEELQKSIEMLMAHSAECGGKCEIEGESMHSGLAVVLQAVCTECRKVFSIYSSPRVKTASGRRW